MGFFDLFKKKVSKEETQSATQQPEVNSSISIPEDVKIDNGASIPTSISQSEEEKEYKETIKQGLEKTKTGFFAKISKALVGKSTVDSLFLDEVEEALVSADVGVDTTIKIIQKLEERVARDKYINSSELNKILKQEILAVLDENNQYSVPDFKLVKTGEPYVIMVVGVNGVGKTTTIGKLAYQFKQRGNEVILGAADTFRAAAVDQLTIWSERVGVPIISRGMNADPAAVAYDTTQSAKAKNMDICIIDTAGRLHNKVGLMNELTKIRNSISKVIEGAPHEVLLVLDASTGQNAIEQAKQFTAATDVNAIALTKLDGTAKGGVVIAIADQFKIPIKYIGLGEKMTDLQPFNKEQFIDTLFAE